jgi:hypothetical protein
MLRSYRSGVHPSSDSVDGWRPSIMSTPLPLLLLLLLASPAHSAETPLIVVTGPTIVAFRVPVGVGELEKNENASEALADFQVYADRASEPLKKAKVDFRVVYAEAFQIRDGKKLVTFRTTTVGIGYYFVAPGMKPAVERGVMTHTDLFDCVRKYFGIVVK